MKIIIDPIFVLFTFCDMAVVEPHSSSGFVRLHTSRFDSHLSPEIFFFPGQS